MTSETAMIMQAWGSMGGILASLAVGLAQCWLIWTGLKQMRQASEDRNRQMDEQEKAADARHRENMRQADHRHRQSMRALEVLIERTGKTA